MRRIYFFSVILSLLISYRSIAQEATIFSDELVSASNQESVNEDNLDMPSIESILYNPGVHKKQKTGKQIQATGFRETNETHFIIHFMNNRLHGEWQSFFSKDQPCDSGRFEKNLPDGEWKTWYANGQLKTVRNYSSKKYHYIKADVKRNHPKDQRYQITRKARSGYNINRYFLPAYESMLIASEFPILEKIKQNTSEQGTNYYAPFKNCLHHGVFINYRENGHVKDSGYYYNGLKQDLWKESENDGGDWGFGFYKHGLREGQWKFYNKQQQLVYTATYRNGKKTGVHYFRQRI
jgi:antitoxin component YwqK of YwqJK toxin-antitoxin module